MPSARSRVLRRQLRTSHRRVRLARYGDATLDENVNLQDFNRLALHFGGTGKLWYEADFNYDGVVNLSDFNLLAANFGLLASHPEGPSPQDWANLAAAVPEPALVGGLAPPLVLLSLRRRRCRSHLRAGGRSTARC
jgi:hypothetical protein